jgi:DNA invertase Pin-like site-specific DNA recombinase
VLIGYIRVSTNDQNTDLQRNALQSANCEHIFADKITGTSIERPGLKRALRALSPGDTLVVWKLDRLGRSVRHLITLVEDLKNRGIHFRSLTDSIDTSTSISIHPSAGTVQRFQKIKSGYFSLPISAAAFTIARRTTA